METTRIIIITGLSGSGKSVAMAAFEDAGYYCVDNMPVALLPNFLELPVKGAHHIAGLAFVMDLREKDFLSIYPSVFASLREKGYDFNILFFEADENTLLRRFSQTRRHHPLSQGKSLLEDIRVECRQMKDLRQEANRVINTTHTNVHELKSIIFNIVQESNRVAPMRLHVMSFGFKYGIPQGADLIADVRFLANPFFVAELNGLNGENDAVRDYVLNDPNAREFLNKYIDLLDYLIPLYEIEGKAYLTVAVGCTGGRHRSVVIARKLFSHIRASGRQVEISHRDMDQ